MFSKSKVKKVDFVTLSKFYGKYKEALQLEPVSYTHLRAHET